MNQNCPYASPLSSASQNSGFSLGSKLSSHEAPMWKLKEREKTDGPRPVLLVV